LHNKILSGCWEWAPPLPVFLRWGLVLLVDLPPLSPLPVFLRWGLILLRWGLILLLLVDLPPLSVFLRWGLILLLRWCLVLLRWLQIRSMPNFNGNNGLGRNISKV
jgi:hypothetical protein